MPLSITIWSKPFAPFSSSSFALEAAAPPLWPHQKPPSHSEITKQIPSMAMAKHSAHGEQKKKKKRMCIPAVFSNYIQCRKELQ
jgi:hypothetical protein